MTDRYAGFFLLATILVAGLAWVVSGDPVRALAVVVVATPYPLILAAPIALVSGLSRAARAGVIVKGAGALDDHAAQRSEDSAVRQDRHPDRRDTRGARDCHPLGIRLRQAAALGRVARSPLRARPRRGSRRGGSRRRDRVDDAGRCPRGAGSGASKERSTVIASPSAARRSCARSESRTPSAHHGSTRPFSARPREAGTVQRPDQATPTWGWQTPPRFGSGLPLRDNRPATSTHTSRGCGCRCLSPARGRAPIAAR